MIKNYQEKDNQKQYKICYSKSEQIVKCKNKYSENCPRICCLWNEEQGENQSIEQIKGIEKKLDKS